MEKCKLYIALAQLIKELQVQKSSKNLYYVQYFLASPELQSGGHWKEMFHDPIKRKQ